MTFNPTDDAFVRSNRPTNLYGQTYELRIRQTSSADYRAYLKFHVNGLASAMQRATLKLYVIDGSDDGGGVYSVSNNYQGTSTAWDEDALTFNNAPEIRGGSLSSIGTVTLGEVVEFDVTAAISGDGEYSFALKSNSSDAVKYSSKEGEQAPELLIETLGSPSLAPQITSITPPSGMPGSEVTIAGRNFTDVTDVSFNGTSASKWLVDSSTQVRITVPFAASTGKISVTTGEGTASSEVDFMVVYAPTISSFSPIEGPPGAEVTLTGTNFTLIAEVSFNGAAASSFAMDSATQLRAVVPSGAASGKISVSNLAGTGVSAENFTVQSSPSNLVFTPSEDAFVRSNRASNNYGQSYELRVRQTFSADYRAYLKFHVNGLASAMQRATLKLYVIDGSDDGGGVYSVSNNYQGTSTAWDEDALTFNNAPEIRGGSLSSIGTVTLGEVVEFDVTAAISGDGVYSFALKNNSSDAVKYSSKEGERSPELLIETLGSPSLAPQITSITPPSGVPGSEVTIAGRNFTDVTDVSFNGTSASKWLVDSSTQVRITVPFAASTGKISVTTGEGTARSEVDFMVVYAPTISSFLPVEGAPGAEVTLTGTNFTLIVEVSFNGAAASNFAMDSATQLRAVVPSGAVSGKISLSNLAGTGVSAEEFTVTALPNITSFTPTEDTFVRSAKASNNYGSDAFMRVRQPHSEQVNSYLKFNVSGLAGEIKYAVIQLYVIDGSEDGGSIYLVSNDLKDSNTSWNEDNLIYSNAPEITGNPLSSRGAVYVDEVVEFDVTAAINDPGVYSFALNNDVNDLVSYSSKEGVQAPELVIETMGSPSLTPQITSFTPTSGVTGSEVTITGSNFNDVTDVSFNGAAASSFAMDSATQLRAVVPSGAASGKISVSNLAGTGVSAENFTVQSSPSNLVFTPSEDAFVRSNRATNNYGQTYELRIRQTFSADYRAYLKFHVNGLASAMQRATLKLYVIDGSDDGGGIYSVSNTYQAAGTAWEEDALTFNNAPEIRGGSLSSVGTVTLGEVVEFDVTAAISGDGEYSFALKSNSSDAVKYSSKEGERSPELLIETLGSPSLAPQITSIIPTSGVPGSEVTVAGSNFTDVTDVSFNGTTLADLNVDSSTQLRLTVPSGASTGKISVTTGEGTASSEVDFVVVYAPTISSFLPVEGAPGAEVTLTGTHFTLIAEVFFNGTLASNFAMDSATQLRAVVPSGAVSGTITVRNMAGTGVSEGDFTVTASPSTMSFSPMEDAFVRSNRSTNNYGQTYELRVRRSSAADFNSYLKFEVIGLSDAVQQATLKLYVIDDSNEGGELYSVSNNYQTASSAWNENELNFDNAPDISGHSLSSKGAVNSGEFVDFDVTAAISGDGVYSFALKSNSTDAVKYSSKEGDKAPELVIQTGEAPSTSPTITAFTPTTGSVGTEVTIIGTNFIGSVSGNSNQSGTLRIMPLGNSITQGVHGSTDNAGYRNDLAELLDSRGIDYNFVGSKSNGWAFDRHHEGHSGYRADELLTGLNGYLTQNPPDMILLHIGTNDISELQTPESTINEISDILDAINNFNSDIITLISSVIPRIGNKNARTTTLNNYIRELTTVKRSAGYHLFYVGNSEAFNANPNWQTEYMDDNVHPNDTGYAVMAGVWFDGIVAVQSDSDNLKVAFNGIDAETIIIDSQTRIRALVPSGASTGKIRVTTSFGTGFSETDFIVAGPAALALTVPKGGEQWPAGSTHILTWQAVETTDYISLGYSLDNGTSWLPISDRAVNNGKFIWRVPEAVSNNCVIRISDASDSRTATVSNGTFSILEQSQQAVVPNLAELKQAAFDQVNHDSELLSRGDIDNDGDVDLFDIINILDINIDQNDVEVFAKQSIDKRENITPVNIFVAEPKTSTKDTVFIPIYVASRTPVRGFQIKFKFDPAKVKFSKPFIKQNKFNLMISSHISANSIEILGYLKKEKSAVDINAELIELLAQLHPDFDGDSDIQITKAIFASKDNRPLKVQIGQVSGELSNLPQEFQLFQNYPNPFNVKTRINFNLPEKTQVNLQIYNLKGELVRTLLNEERKAGQHKIIWDGINSLCLGVASGTYVYRLNAGKFEMAKMMVLLK